MHCHRGSQLDALTIYNNYYRPNAPSWIIVYKSQASLEKYIYISVLILWMLVKPTPSSLVHTQKVICTDCVPVYDDRIRGCVILVTTRSMLQTPTADQFVREQHSSEVRILARSFISHQLRLHIHISCWSWELEQNLITKTFAHRMPTLKFGHCMTLWGAQ